jgi:hypothetical protein
VAWISYPSHGPRQALSADAETRRLAFVRERTLLDEASLLNDAREEGLEKGREEGKDAARRETAVNLIRQSGRVRPLLPSPARFVSWGMS